MVVPGGTGSTDKGLLIELGQRLGPVQTDRQHADRLAERQTDRQKARLTGRQTDR